MRRSKGFTLIELLAVIAIMGFLAATLVVATVGLKAHAKIERADALIRNLSTGCEAYFTVFRDYPSDQPKLTVADKLAGKAWTAATPGDRFLYDYLCKPQVLAGSYAAAGAKTKTVGPFCEIPDSELSGPDTGKHTVAILDPWGTPVWYELPGFTHGTNFPDTSKGESSSTNSKFDITSGGPNQKLETLGDKVNAYDDRANWIIDRK
jgi:prepilin-type N-terminal cleavage/methylation domain-containing protein